MTATPLNRFAHLVKDGAWQVPESERPQGWECLPVGVFVVDPPAPLETPTPPPTEPADGADPYAKNRAWRQRQIAAGRCPRCGNKAPADGYECTSCKNSNRRRKAREKRQRLGYQPWSPERQIGKVPKHVRELCRDAKRIHRGMALDFEALADDKTVQAATAMVVGFLAGQDIALTSYCTGFPVADVACWSDNLTGNRIWIPEERAIVVCLWMDQDWGTPHERLMSLICDGMVAEGQLRRSGKSPDFLYTLVKPEPKVTNHSAGGS